MINAESSLFHPGNLSVHLTMLAAMVALAGLDFIGAILAKEWTERKDALYFAGGALAFLMLFAFYAHTLKTADLSLVTIGWIVFLQVGLLLVDRFHYGVTLTIAQWLAIAVMIGLQIFLVSGLASSPRES